MKGLEEMTKEEGKEIIKDIIKESHSVNVYSITVFGRRWFQKTFGNTYNTVDILVNGESVAQLPFHYGYGDFYIQRAVEWLIENGYIKTTERHVALWRYCEENNIKLTTRVTDVTRKRDL